MKDILRPLPCGALLLVVLCTVAMSHSLRAQWVHLNTPSDNIITSFATSSIGRETHLFAGTRGGGIFLSTDNGAVWKTVNVGLNDSFVTALVTSDTFTFAGTSDSGVFLSTNDGTSWRRMNSGLTGVGMAINCLALAPHGTGSIYLFAGTGGGIFLSTNMGTTWTSRGLTNTYISALAVTSDAQGGTDIFAGTLTEAAFRSSDYGANWNSVDSGMTGHFSRLIRDLMVRGSDLFAVTPNGGIFVSSNKGSSWEPIPSPSAELRTMGVSGPSLFCGTRGGGVYLSTRTGGDWHAVNCGLTNSTIERFVVIGTDLFAGTENGVWRRSLLGARLPVDMRIIPTKGYPTASLVESGIPPHPLTLHWHGVSLDFLDAVHIQASEDSTFFSQPTIDSTLMAGGDTLDGSLETRGLSERTPYFWRLAAQGLDGSSSEWSEVWSFTTASGSISGIIFDDLDHDSVRSDGDPGVAAWPVSVTGKLNLQLATDPDGNFSLHGLDSGVYVFDEQPRTLGAKTFPPHGSYAINLQPNDTIGGVDFGNYFPWNSIRGTLFHDQNDNGAQDSGEPGLSKWSVRLRGSLSADDSLMTDSAGGYAFRRVEFGMNSVNVVVQAGWEQIFPPLGEGYSFDMLTYGHDFPGADFGLHPIPARSKITLTIHDSNVGLRDIWCGAIPGATYGIWGVDSKCTTADFSEGEFEIPPPLPGLFDARFRDPRGGLLHFGYGSWTDMREFISVGQIDSFLVSFQPGSNYGGHYPMTLSWSKERVASCYRGPVTIADSFGTCADMKFADSLVISNDAVSSVTIIAANPVISTVDVRHASDNLPRESHLYQNYPNPFNPRTTLRYSLARPSHVRLSVYDILGREIALLVDRDQSPGTREVNWDADGIPSGIYFYRIQTKDFVQVGKMAVVR